MNNWIISINKQIKKMQEMKSKLKEVISDSEAKE